MIQLAASDLYPKGTNETGRKACAASLLTGVNLAFRGSGAKGCRITAATLDESADGHNMILTLTAVPGDAPATLDDVRRFFQKGM